MIEMALLKPRALLRPSKETQNKLRWATQIEADNAKFQFYIPKSRVPEPWPGRIYVQIQSFEGDPSRFVPSPIVPGRLERSIRVLVEPVSEHTCTVRYKPIGDSEEWQIGEPYIPYSLIPPDSHFLVIVIEWDLSSKGKFVHVPTYRRNLTF